MTSISRPELSRRWWTTVCPDALESKYLATALAALERAERESSNESAELLAETLNSVAKAIERTQKDCDRRANSDVIDALSDLTKQIARKRADLKKLERELENELEEEKEEEESEEPEESEDALLDVERVRKLMRRLPDDPMAFAFGVGESGVTYLVLDRKRKGAALMTKLKDASGCSKASFGIASVEGKELCLDVHGPKLGGMKSKVRGFLRENQPMPYTYVRVNGAEDEEDDDEPEEQEPRRYALGEDSDPEEPRRYALGEDSDPDEPKRYALGEDSDPDQPNTYRREEPVPSEEPSEPPTPFVDPDDPPLNMVAPYGIAASVGAGGKNGSDDVQAVQTALNRRGAHLEVDGKCGPATIAAIKAFQKLMGFTNPDGLIERGGYTDRALAGENVVLPKPKPQPYSPQRNGGGRERIPHEMEESYDPEGGEKIRPRQGYEVVEKDTLDYARDLAKKVLLAKKAADQRMEELRRAAAEGAGEAAGRILQKVEELYERGAENARGIGESVRDLTQRAFEADQEAGRRVREEQVEALRKAAELAQRGFESVSSGVEKGLRWLESQDMPE